MESYRTIAKAAVVEQIIEKSRFIGYISPVESRDEAEEFLREIRKKHKDATHNVPAFIIGDKSQVQWASDDGEPSGTSGAPMLHMLAGEELTNVIIVVTRYFGGIKLGTGGLMRAYTGTARMALDAAGVCEVRELDTLEFNLDYTYWGKLQNMEQDGSFTIAESNFTDKVGVKLIVSPENTEGLVTALSEMTGGVICRDAITFDTAVGKTDIK